VSYEARGDQWRVRSIDKVHSNQIKSNHFNSDTTGPYIKKEKADRKSADRQTDRHLKERFVIFKEERVGGRARVTIDEERVL